MRAGSITKRIKGIAIDLDYNDIGDKGAAEAIAVMLLWSRPTLTRLQLKCSSQSSNPC